ncbi:MAG: WecB/TagA/CpsF family glycosyltransferase [Treponema sp.]|nr:WecB/TagA/CpsF family glycosyltransferase [Treponema sp.]
MEFERINIIGVPVSICSPEQLDEAMLELLAMPGTKQIVFLSIWDLLKARGKSDYAKCIHNADLVLPVSKSILWGARILKKHIPFRHNPFTTMIDILSVLESHLKSLYLLGGRLETLRKAETNVRTTFPALKILGRHTGYYPKYTEDNIIEAIYKASPSLVLISEGIKEKDCWAYERRNQFSSSIFLYYRDAFGIFSERIKRIDEKTFDRGTEIFTEISRNPLKFFLLFPFLWYILILIWYRLFKK